MGATEMTTADAIEKLPKRCPAWCASGPKGHLQALEEGNTVEDSCEHMSVDLNGLLPDLVNHLARRVDRAGGAAWDVRLLQGDVGGYMTFPVIELAVRQRWEESWQRVALRLTTAEARKLAAQLTYLADQEDLHHYDGMFPRE